MINRKFCILMTAVGLLMAVSLSGCAPVTVSSIPSGAGVYEKDSGKLLGTAPVKVNMIAGGKELVVRKDGYFSQTVAVSPIDPVSITVRLPRRDQVLVLSHPDGADLYVEGVGRVGKTPYRMDYEKPYRVFELRAEGYASRSFTVPEDPEGDIVIDLERDDAVHLVTTPKNAEVFDLQGKRLGGTPLAVPATEARSYEIRKDGYYSRQVAVGPETVSPFVVELEREPHITVYSEPEGAYVIHRGVVLGQTPFRHLVKEDMEIELRADRYYSATVTIAPDSPKQVDVVLEPKPYVTIMTDPPRAELYRSGGVEMVGVTPVEVLIEKDSAFEIHKDGYDIKPFILSPESASMVTVPLVQSIGAAEKTILIDSDPSGAEVYRPGGAELIGKTPFEQRVRGERTFELQLEGYRTKIVTVANDSSDSVVFALAKDESARNVTVSDPLLNTPSSF